MRPSCTEVLFAGVLIVLTILGAAALEKQVWWPLEANPSTLRWMLTMLAIMGLFNGCVFLYQKARMQHKRQR